MILNLVRFWYAMRNHYFSTVIFNDASTSGFESVLIICSRLHACVSICQMFMKSFDTENVHKVLNYAFLKI